jgi:hypothetical protein
VLCLEREVAHTLQLDQKAVPRWEICESDRFRERDLDVVVKCVKLITAVCRW